MHSFSLLCDGLTRPFSRPVMAAATLCRRHCMGRRSEPGVDRRQSCRSCQRSRHWPPSATGDKWRFVWHNNQWWYYKPNGQWLIHDGSAWHSPETVAPTGQVYRPAPSYGYSNQAQPRYRQFMGSGRNGGGMSNDGFWGNSSRYWTYQHVLRGTIVPRQEPSPVSRYQLTKRPEHAERVRAFLSVAASLGGQRPSNAAGP